MDPSKRDTLIQWINAIHPKETIESLLELRDGEQMIDLITTITSKSYDNVTVRKERYEVIQKFIEDYYSYDFCGQVHFDSDNELNIAKILVLVLSAGVQSEQQEEFMTPALSLDQRSQLEIMDILKEIVSDSPSKLNLDSIFASRSDDTFDSVDVSCLFSPERTKTESKSCSATAPSNGEPLQNRSTSTSSLNEILSPFGRINVGYSPACTTPLHSLINSTGFSGRIIQRERNLRRKAENDIEIKVNLIKKLSSELNMERHLRSDVELEMQEKVRTINSKDDKIRDLMTQNRSLKKLQDKLDELNTLQEEYDQMVTEIEKSKSSVGELKDLRLQNSSLKKEMNELYEELHDLKEMKSQFKILQLDCKKYVKELQKGEKKFASLQANLDLKQRALDDAVNSKNFTEDHLVKMKEMYEDLKRQNEELVVFQSANELPGEKMSVITNHLMDELKTELDDLKSTWIQPNMHEELKIQLANIVTERDSFESKSLKLSEEVFQVQSDNDMLKKKNEDFEIDLEKCQRHLQESQRNIEKLTANLDAFVTKEAQWHQTEMKYKTELQQLQTKMCQTQMELSCVSTELKLANAQLENDNKSSEMRRQTLVQSVGELRNEKKKLEQTYEAEKAVVEEKAKSLKSQLETLKMEFASREQELLAENESVAMERKDLEQQLETEKRLRENVERNLTSQREEVEEELNEMIGQLKEDVKVAEAESQRLRHQLREKIDEYDGQVESLTNLKFDLQGKVSKLESQVRLDKQENLKLQTEMKVSGERCEEFELNIGKLTEKLNKLIVDKKDCQEKLQEFEKKHEVALEESQHWIDKNSSDKKMFETQIKTLEQERTEFAESTRCALEKLSGELKSSLDENFELKSQLQKRTDLLTKTRQDLEEKLHQAETLQDQLSQLQQLHDHSQEQNFLLNTNFVTTKSQLACKESELTDLASKLDELLVEKTYLVESHEKELGATRQALSQEIVNLNQQIENSKSNLACFVDQVAKVTNVELSIGDVTDQSLDIGKLVESVGKDIFHTVEDNSKKLAVAEERCTLQETRLLEVEENLQVKNREAEMLERNLEESRDQCQYLETVKGEQQHQLEENAAFIKSLEEQKTVLDSQIVSDKESFMTQLENAIAEGSMASRLVEEKTAVVTELKEQSNELDNELKSVREDMCQLEADNEKLLQKRKEIEEELSENKLHLLTAEENASKMSLVLTEKNSLIESQLENQSQLEESIATLNQKLSANDHETNLLKSNLEQKEALLEEKKTEFVDLSETLEATQRQIVKLGDEHKSAMAAIQQEMMLDYEQKLDAVVADYENKICENYVGKSVIVSLEVKRQAEIEELKEFLEQEHKKVVEELQVKYEAGVNDLKNQFETQMLQEAEEQNRKRETEIEELRENLEQKHIKAVEELQVEHEAGISDLKTQLSCEMQEQNQKYETEMKELKENLEQKHTKVVEELQVEHEAGVSDVKAQFETELSCKEQEQNQKRETEIKELRENLEQEHKKVVEDLQVEYEAGVSDLKAQFETRLSCEAQEQNRKHFLEVDQLQKNVKEYCNKMESQQEEHKAALEKVVWEYQEKITNDFIANSVFAEHKEKHKAEITQIQNELAVDHEKKVHQITEEHQLSLKNLESSYEEKLIADYVPRQVVEEEKENLLLEVRKVQDVELQEKVTALQQEHEALITQNEHRNQELSAEIAASKSELADIMAKLSDKEKELSKQRAEFALIVATSENVKEQNQASVGAYELRVSELEEKLRQQEMHVSCLEEQVVNEKSEGERQANEIKKRLEEQVTALKKHLDTAQQVLSTANEMHKVESDQLRTQVNQLESCNQDKISQLTENYNREFEQMKQDYKEKIFELETTYKAEIDQLKECHLQEVSASHAKYEEIQQNFLSSQMKAEEAVSLKEQEMKAVHAETEKQLKTEKFLIEEKLSVLEDECNKLKNDHESTLKSKEDQIDSLNLHIAELNEECRTRQGKCDKVERQLREREQKLIVDNMKILSKAKEMNRSLSNQLQVAQKEVSLYQKKTEVAKKEVEGLNDDLKLVKQMKQKTVNELQEHKINCMELKENFSSEKSQLERTIRELKEQYTESIAEIENLKKLVKHYENREENKLSKVIQQNELDQRNIEKLTNKVFGLEQEKKSLADKLKREEEKYRTYDKENRTLQRKISDLSEQLEKAGNALFSGSNEIDFPNDSLDSPDIQEITKRTYELRSKSNTLKKMGVEDFNISPMSFQSRNSISSVRSFASNVSNISKTSKPSVCAQMFSCEDEPATFDWGRITEIRRRNTMVPAHLRSTYPTELQNVPNSVSDEITNASRSGSAKRKRKSPVSVNKTQQTKVAGNRPATPGKVRRVRGRIHDENVPQSDKRLRTSTPQSKPDYTGRPSMVFEISNTPKLSKRRQKGRSTIFQLPDQKREPLKTRNSYQTNL